VAVTGVTSSEATISWQTDRTADSRVVYGLTASYGSSTTLDPTLVSVHSQTLSSLPSLTVYHFQVISRDAYGHTGVSADLTFTTLPGPPLISGISISDVTIKGATISRTTDAPADSQVAYGPTPACGFSTALNTAMVTTHSQRLEGLTTATACYFRVLSRSATGFPSTSSLGNFETTTIQPMELMIPRLVTTAGSGTAGVDDSLYTGVAISNIGPQAAALTFTAYDINGDIIAGGDIVNPAQRTFGYRQAAVWPDFPSSAQRT
jgi:hypothetical protein